MTKVKLVRLAGSGYSGMFSQQVISTEEVQDKKQLIKLVISNLTADDQAAAKSYNERITQKNFEDNLEGDLSSNICSLVLDEEMCILILQNESASISENFEKVFDDFINELYELN